MTNLEAAVRWRPWSIAIVLAIFISLFALNQFGLLSVNNTTWTGCGVLALSVSWNIYVMKLAQSRSKLGWHGQMADGLLLTGLILVFFGAFF
jgi:hypothetical protein